MNQKGGEGLIYREILDERELLYVVEFCYGILGGAGNELYSVEAWRGRFLDGLAPLVVAVEGGVIVSAVLGRAESEDSLIVGFAACREEFRRRGITRELLGYFEKLARERGFKYITLGSREDAFYLKCGYRVIFQVNGQNVLQKVL